MPAPVSWRIVGEFFANYFISFLRLSRGAYRQMYPAWIRTPNEKVHRANAVPHGAERSKTPSSVFNNGPLYHGCHIVDMSDTGPAHARPDILSWSEVIRAKLRFGRIPICEVMWRRGTKIGVYYAF